MAALGDRSLEQIERVPCKGDGVSSAAPKFGGHKLERRPVLKSLIIRIGAEPKETRLAAHATQSPGIVGDTYLLTLYCLPLDNV